tara:strand:- start:667 stop:1062 length:396 start_codon:yes stop_codon:yes gene_type:complete
LCASSLSKTNDDESSCDAHQPDHRVIGHRAGKRASLPAGLTGQSTSHAGGQEGNASGKVRFSPAFYEAGGCLDEGCLDFAFAPFQDICPSRSAVERALTTSLDLKQTGKAAIRDDVPDLRRRAKSEQRGDP